MRLIEHSTFRQLRMKVGCLDPETWEGFIASLILSSNMSDRHHWQPVRETSVLQDFLWSEWTRATPRWEFLVQTQTQTAPHLTPLAESFWKQWRKGTKAKEFHSVWVFSKRSKSLTFPPTFLNPHLHTWIVERSKRPSKQPHPLLVACGMA
jgi:hypothetical protein